MNYSWEVEKAQPTTRIPTEFLGRFTDLLLAQVRGAGSRARRNQLAAQVSQLLLDYQGRGEIGGTVALEICGRISKYLDSAAREDDPLHREFGCDPESGALCWTPPALARALGFAADDADLAKGVARLSQWRLRGEGPPFVKLGDAKSSPILYPVAEAILWLEAHKEQTEILFPRRETAEEAAA